jgi:hypothetical protein
VVLVGACGFRGKETASDGPGPIDARAVDAAAIDAQLHDAPPSVPDAMADAAIAIDSPPALTCPSTAGWKVLANGGGHYFFSTVQKHWSAAEADCESRGVAAGFSATHLAAIDNLAEALAVGATLTTAYEWVGAFQPLGSTGKGVNWRVVTGGSAYLNWSGGEPSDHGNNTEMGDENFAQLFPNGTFNDTSGTDNLNYVCECDGVPVDAATLLLVPPGN